MRTENATIFRGNSARPRHRRRRGRGITSVIALLYLILMTTLAVGFYAVTTTSARMSNNDQRIARALLAADAGMEFMRYHMAAVAIPATTPADQLFDALFTQLGSRLNHTDNMPTGCPLISRSGDGNTIYIPASNKYIDLDGIGSSFRAEIRKVGNGQSVQAFVFGKYQSAETTSQRCIHMDFGNASTPSSVLGYGLATKGTLSLSATAHVSSATAGWGSVLSTSAAANPITMTSGLISGDVSMSSAGTISWSESPQVAQLAPAQWDGPPTHVHTGVAAPAFPAVDTSAYESYLDAHSPTIINTSPSDTAFTNIRIAAGTDPTFPSGSTIQGVVVIETPNHVTFAGSATLQGVIVVANSAGGVTDLSASNSITFNGSLSAADVSSLDDSFAELRSLGGGAIILAPTFKVTFAGSSNSLGGSIAASKLVMTGSACGSVSGCVIILDDQPTALSDDGGITITAQAPAGGITGFRFDSHYDPRASSYEEVTP